MNLVLSGRIDYLFAGERGSISAGGNAVFWAGLPHQLVGTDSSPVVAWLTIPLATVLAWQVPDRVVSRLLNGRLLLSRGPDPGAGKVSTAGAGSAGHARRQFEQWAVDLGASDPEMEQIALLEIEAFFLRIAQLEDPAGEVSTAVTSSRARARAAQMATFVARHFREPIAVEDVAKAAHLHPHYAMQAFRIAVGTTIGTYVTQRRLAEAQRLLITTSLTVASVAAEAGFGSSGRLYAAFAQAGITVPATYRRINQSEIPACPEVGLDGRVVEVVTPPFSPEDP